MKLIKNVLKIEALCIRIVRFPLNVISYVYWVNLPVGIETKLDYNIAEFK
jgi:hypothetical protein